MPGKKAKSAKQVRYLMSSGSPLSGSQKSKLQGELRSGAVRIKKKPKSKRK